MKLIKRILILGLTLLVFAICGFEIKKTMSLEPKVELVAHDQWSLTPQQLKEFERISQSFSGSLSSKNFVSEFSSIFNKLSDLNFLEDARWAWDHKEPFKIKAYLSEPKFMMFKYNQWYLINKKGAVLRKVGQSQTLDLPILRSEDLFKNEKIKGKTIKILQAFEHADSPIPISAVSDLNIDARGISVLLSEGFKVYLSDMNTDTQIQRISNVIAYLKKENITPEFIDAQHVQKILVRPKAKKD